MNEVLHAVRVKGIATPEAVAAATGLDADAVLEELQALEADGLVLQRPSKKRPGWVVTEEGRERHAADLAGAHDPETLASISDHYAGFLAVNSEIKGVAAKWQQATGDDQRFVLIERVEQLHEQAEPALAKAGQAAPRYGRYAQRLGVALQKLDEDARYFVSPLVDSYHTVWFECHEDFLLTLGRTRAGEGSE